MNDTKLSLGAALDSLDPAIDAHWTKKGEPSLNAVKELTGKQFTRADAEAERPGLSRDTAAGYQAGAAQPIIGKVPTGDVQQYDFVAVLDACLAAMDNNTRIYCEALHRTLMYYKAERETITRQIENATARNKVVIIGPTLTRSSFQNDGSAPEFQGGDERPEPEPPESHVEKNPPEPEPEPAEAA